MENESKDKEDNYFQYQNKTFHNFTSTTQVESKFNSCNQMNEQGKINYVNCVYVDSSIYDNPDYYGNFSNIPYLNGFEHYSIFKRNISNQKIPIKTLNDNEYIYVNCRQYYRILKRREKRKKLKELYNINDNIKKNYMHESRHKHAMNRERGKRGRFLSKKEKEILEKEQLKEKNKEEETKNGNDTLSSKSSITSVATLHDSEKMKII